MLVTMNIKTKDLESHACYNLFINLLDLRLLFSWLWKSRLEDAFVILLRPHYMAMRVISSDIGFLLLDSLSY